MVYSSEMANGQDRYHCTIETPIDISSDPSAAEKDEKRLDELRVLFGKAEGDPLRIVGVGAGAWGSVFLAMIQVRCVYQQSAASCTEIFMEFYTFLIGCTLNLSFQSADLKRMKHINPDNLTNFAGAGYIRSV